MHRRDFLKKSAAALAASPFVPIPWQGTARPKRVGLIGAGWYGKTDLLRLVQVAPVEVVSLCDVDRRMLADAAALVATRQQSKKTPRTYSD
jgi:predicted dehydrogenase